MRFREFSNSTLRPYLLEHKKTYKNMMGTMVRGGIISQEEADDTVKQIRLLLRRQDRIVWWLYWWRISTTGKVIEKKIQELENKQDSHDPSLDASQPKEDTEQQIIQLKNLYQRVTKTNFDYYLKQNIIEMDFEVGFSVENLKNHWSGMFRQSPQVNAVEWSRGLNPSELYSRITKAESEWRKKIAQGIVRLQPGDRIVIDYGKYAWVKLDREYCDDEGTAMGHCGNSNAESGDRILSFRTKISSKKQKPHLTFILDKNGYLGEMKGHSNNKPDKKYHPYIIDLLKRDFVRGIKGGGYLPENNFSMFDLEEEKRLALIEQNPRLGTSYDILKIDGNLSERFYERLEFELDAYTTDSLMEIDIDKDSHSVTLDSGYNMSEIDIIYEKLEGNTLYLDLACDLMTGERSITEVSNVYKDYVRMIMDDYVSKLFESLDPEYQSQIEKFVKENYSDDVVWNGDSIEEIVSQVPELDSLFKGALAIGVETGIEAEIISDFKEWMVDNYVHFDLYSNEFIFAMESSELSELIHTATEEDFEDEMALFDYILAYVNIDDFDEPRNGWEGFDLDQARRHLEDTLVSKGIVKD